MIWVSIIGFLVVGLGAQRIAQVVRFGAAQTYVTWAAGFLAIVCSLAAGALAVSAWVGTTAVPFVARLHPYVSAALGLAAIAAAVLIVLAAIPDRWSALPASGLVVGLAFLAPTLIGYLPAGDVPDAARASITAFQSAASEFTRGWFR